MQKKANTNSPTARKAPGRTWSLVCRHSGGEQLPLQPESRLPCSSDSRGLAFGSQENIMHCMCAYIHVYIYIYIHTHIYRCRYTYTHTCVCISIYLPTYLPIYLSTYLPIYLLYVYIYVSIHLSLSLSRSPPDQVMMRAHYGARAHCGMTIRVPS